MTKNEKQQYMIFASNLRRHYERWKSVEYGRNQDKLAKAVGLADRKSISNYMKAVNYPDPVTLQRLCEVLETTPEELNGLNDSFRKHYQYDEDTADSVRRGYDAFCSGIGLNNDFLKYIRSALPDESFPLFAPIQSDPMIDQYIRRPAEETAVATYGKEYQIVTCDNIHTDLTYPDYAFLKDVQDQVTELIEYLYFKRKKQLDEALKKVNDEFIITSPDGLTFTRQVSKTKLCESDPYYRFILGDAGSIIEEELQKEGKNNGKH